METNSHEDIVIDILSRLPVKSVKRFKCVSRSWNKLISDPYFKAKHLNYAKNQNNSQRTLLSQVYREESSFYFYSASLSPSKLVKGVEKLDFPSDFARGFCKVYCCCDGLFLIGIYHRISSKDPVLLLWNPSTREYVRLPHPQHVYSTPNGASFTRPTFYGLGYDSASGDYKVVKVEQASPVPNQILSLKTGSWQNIEGNPREYCSSERANGMDSLAFLYGAFHWHGRYYFSLISLNISNEVYGEIPLPERMTWTYNMINRGVIVLGGMLCINCVYRNECTFLDLWVMKDYGVKESWTKLFTLTETRIPTMVPIIPKYMYADGEVMFSCGRKSIFMTSRGPYGLSNKEWSLPSDDAGRFVSLHGYVYTESLISPRVNLLDGILLLCILVYASVLLYSFRLEI